MLEPDRLDVPTKSQASLDKLNYINQAFAEMGETVVAMELGRTVSVDDIPASYVNESISPSTNFKISLPSIDTIVDLIGSLKVSKAAGLDGIPVRLIKDHPKVFANILKHIFTIMVNTGIYPRSLKTSLIHPIYKSQSPSVISNYRPIALLSVFNKIFEKLLVEQLRDYFVKRNIIHPEQFGFQKYKSTEQPCLLLLNRILSTVESKGFGLAIFLDLKKAFDTVHHGRLLRKLQAYGVAGNSLKLISFLDCGHQQASFVERWTQSDASEI